MVSALGKSAAPLVTIRLRFDEMLNVMLAVLVGGTLVDLLQHFVTRVLVLRLLIGKVRLNFGQVQAVHARLLDGHAMMRHRVVHHLDRVNAKARASHLTAVLVLLCHRELAEMSVHVVLHGYQLRPRSVMIWAQHELVMLVVLWRLEYLYLIAKVSTTCLEIIVAL